MKKAYEFFELISLFKCKIQNAKCKVKGRYAPIII